MKGYAFKSVIEARKQAMRELEFFNKMTDQLNNLNAAHHHTGIKDGKVKSIIEDKIRAEGNINFLKKTENNGDGFNANTAKIKACEFESVIEAKKQAHKKLEFFHKMMDQKNNLHVNHNSRI